MELTTSWERKGITRGITQGHSKTILKLLKRKFGALDSALVEQIRSFEADRLDSLTEDLLDFQTIGDLPAWLSKI